MVETTDMTTIIKSLADMRAACSNDECELMIARNVCEHIRTMVYDMEPRDEQDVIKVLLDFTVGVLEHSAKDLYTICKLASDALSVAPVE